MDTVMWALVVGISSAVLALACLCFTLYVMLRPPRDSDVEELADEVSKLARRSRADTMRRVRAEAAAPSPDGVADLTIPPQLKQQAQAANVARDPRAMKDAIRKRLLGGNGGNQP